MMRDSGLVKLSSKRLGAEPFHIFGNWHHQLIVAQRVEDSPRPAVLAQAMLEAEGHRRAEILFPKGIAFDGDAGDDIIGAGQRLEAVGGRRELHFGAKVLFQPLSKLEHPVQSDRIEVYQHQFCGELIELRRAQHIGQDAPAEPARAPDGNQFESLAHLCSPGFWEVVGQRSGRQTFRAGIGDDAGQLGLAYIGFAQVNRAQIGPLQVSAAQVCISQIGPRKVGPAQIG